MLRIRLRHISRLGSKSSLSPVQRISSSPSAFVYVVACLPCFMSLLQPNGVESESGSETGGWWPPPDSLGRSYLAAVPGFSLSTWEELCADVNEPPNLPSYNVDEETCEPQEPHLARLEPQRCTNVQSSLVQDEPPFSRTHPVHLELNRAQPSVIQIQPDLPHEQQGRIQIQQSSIQPHPSLMQQPSVMQIQRISTEPQSGISYDEVDLSQAERHSFQLQPNASSSSHITYQVGFLEVFWDQPNNRTPRIFLRWFGALYTIVLEWSYFCQTLLLCPCATCCWSCCFGWLSFMDAWICKPMLMLIKSLTAMVELVLQVVCNICMHPLVKSCGLVFSRFHITHMQIHTTLGRHFFHRDWD